MSLIVNRPYPIKICYLKDENNKASQQQQQQKVSLTFLSSFIQQQKHSLGNTKKDFEQKIKQIVQNQQMGQQRRNKPKTNATTYDKWRKRKTKSQSEDKRMLTNLVGFDWASHVTNQSTNLNPNKKQKRTIRERMETFQDDQRKCTNKKLMETHFKTFLSNKKQQPILVESIQQHCFTTNLDTRNLMQSKPANLLSKFRTVNYIRGRQNLISSQKKIREQREPQIKNYNKSFSIHPTLLRSGFKQLGNFKWSRLNKEEKFKLNDHGDRHL